MTYVLAGLFGAALFVGLPLAALKARSILARTESPERAGALKAAVWGAWLTWGSLLAALGEIVRPGSALWIAPLFVCLPAAYFSCKIGRETATAYNRTQPK